MKIIGMRIEKYIGQVVEGYNCDFEYKDTEMEKHVILGINSDGTKVEISLWEEYDVCGSGWRPASWGRISVDIVSNFKGYQYRPKRYIEIDDINIFIVESFYDEEDFISNKVFEVSAVGGDAFYPCGYYSVKMDMFVPNGREKTKRPVWIFRGDSNSGKSYLSHSTSKSVYETDSNNELPSTIMEDIIVLGNKYNFTIEEIKKAIFGEYELIVVDFEIQK